VTAVPAITELGRRTGAELATVAQLYFAIGEALGLPGLARRLAETPVDSHWQADARESMLDKLAQLQRQVSESVLAEREAASGVEPAAWLDGWRVARTGKNRPLALTTGDLGSSGEPVDYAAYVVLLRALEDIAATAVTNRQ